MSLVPPYRRAYMPSFATVVLGVIERLSPEFGQIVPFDAIHDEVPLPTEDLHWALERLEAQWLVDLHLAQSPMRLSTRLRSLAIRRPDPFHGGERWYVYVSLR